MAKASRLKRWPASWTAPCSSPAARPSSKGHPLARLYRRIRAWRIAEGTTEILRLTVARGLLAADPRPQGDRSDASQQAP